MNSSLISCRDTCVTSVRSFCSRSGTPKNGLEVGPGLCQNRRACLSHVLVDGGHAGDGVGNPASQPLHLGQGSWHRPINSHPSFALWGFLIAGGTWVLPPSGSCSFSSRTLEALAAVRGELGDCPLGSRAAHFTDDQPPAESSDSMPVLGETPSKRALKTWASWVPP